MPYIQQVQNKICVFALTFDACLSDTWHGADLLLGREQQPRHNTILSLERRERRRGPQQCHLTFLRKQTNTQKLPANVLQSLLRETARTDLIYFLFRKRKRDKPKHQGKTVYYPMHKTTKHCFQFCYRKITNQ